MGLRVHITGASGAGVTTLGRGLAQALAIPHHDTDDFYWLPGPEPFRRKRPIPDRLALMEALFLPRPAWVLTGSLSGWGDPLIPRFTHVVFLVTPTPVRLARLRAREGVRRNSQGIPAAEVDAFLEWAASYDQPDFPGRSAVRHRAWLADLTVPVHEADGSQPPDQVLAGVRRFLGA